MSTEAAGSTGATIEQHIAQRLEMGAREYGDSSYGRPLGGLIGEMAEEAADLAAWGEIAATVLAGSERFTPAQRATVARSLAAASLHAARAWEALRKAIQTAEETP